MARRTLTVVALALLGASALAATSASAQTVGFGLTFNVPGVSVAIGTPAVAPAPYVAPVPAYGVAPYRPHYRRWARAYAPVVVRPPVVAYPAPVIVRPRPVVYAAPYYGWY